MNLNNYVEKGIPYSDYLDKIKIQLSELEINGDPKNIANYYALNLRRIERLDKSFKLSPEQIVALEHVNPEFTLLVISEGWCGDAAQSMPIVNTMMTQIGVKQKIVFRDENEELIDLYLTNGSRSIPIYIGVDSNGNELFRYGPRPEEGQKMLKMHKENPEVYTSDEFHKDLQVWYNKNAGQDIVNELTEIMRNQS